MLYCFNQENADWNWYCYDNIKYFIAKVPSFAKKILFVSLLRISKYEIEKKVINKHLIL